MVFRPNRTFAKPSQGANQNRGFPAPGASYQTTGDYIPPPRESPWAASQPTKGKRTFFNPSSGANLNRGQPSPESRAQSRGGQAGLVGVLAGDPASYGGHVDHEYPYFSKGAARWAPQFGGVSYNPIGAGVPVPFRTQATYGPAAQYENGAIWWTSQAIPTSVNLQGLTNPDALAAILGSIQVQAVVRED